MAIDALGVGSVADLASTVISRIWPDKSEAERQQLSAALALVQGQLGVNKVEAASPSVFTSGWRPFIGWVCGAALVYQYLLRPLAGVIVVLLGHPLPVLPSLDDNLWQLLTGLLGLSGLRTIEKLNKAA